MRILAIDLGRHMGVAYGDAGFIAKIAPAPIVRSVILRGTAPEYRVRFLATWLRALLCNTGFDLIITEAPLKPAASKSAQATVDLLGYYFCLHAVAELHDVKVATAPIAAIRKHFCGIARAPSVRGRKRTAKEAAAARKMINDAVLSRAILLGYLPAGSTDWDQANACSFFDYAAAKFARATPAELTLFGEG